MHPDDPGLVDRTGTRTIATTDPAHAVIRLSSDIPFELIDRVMLHEMAHVISHEYGIDLALGNLVDDVNLIPIEEMAAQTAAEHSMELVAASSRALGRPVCVDGVCILGLDDDPGRF